MSERSRAGARIDVRRRMTASSTRRNKRRDGLFVGPIEGRGPRANGGYSGHDPAEDRRKRVEVGAEAAQELALYDARPMVTGCRQ